jgi:molybdenum cofactor biosynthesis protein MoaC
VSDERSENQELILNVRLFALLRERAGADTVQLCLAPGATVADALRSLARLDALSEPLARMHVVMAVNREYADPLTELSSDDELALIPPLSGGSTAADARLHVAVSRQPLSRERLRALVSDPGAGAIVTFEGVTRTVERLDYEAYEQMAQERIERIVRDCARLHDVRAIAAEHRVGAVALGEPSVIVAVSAAHRQQAFAAAREAIDQIKAQAPIWKREAGAGAQQDSAGSEAETDGWVQGTPAPIDTPDGARKSPPAGEQSAEDGSAAEIQRLTHLDRDGSARMVDVGTKAATERIARARARVRMSPASARAVQAGDGPKGEVLGVARIAGIQAAKLTAQLIPLAHPLPLSFVDVSAGVDVEAGVVELIGEARTVARTGVEMEAMTACAVAALAVYDMVKGLERGIELEQIVLLEKRGGRSDYRRHED